MERLAGRVMLSSGMPRAAIAIVCGAVGALALAPLNFFAVQFLSFPVLVWLLDGASGNPDRGFIGRLFPAFAIGWLFGLGYFVASLWWLGNALLVEGGIYVWAMPLAVLGLPAFLAVYYGLAAMIARLLWSEGMGRIAALAFAFGLAEWLRSVAFTGFPWNSVGYAIMPFPLMMQSVHIVGLLSMNVLAVFVFAAPALLATRRGRVPGTGLAVVLFAAHLGYGAWSLSQQGPAPDPEPKIVRLVQPGIPLSDTLSDQQRGDIFEKHLGLTAAPPADGRTRPDVIIWPETAIPFILSDHQDSYGRIADTLQEGQVLLAGAVREEDGGAGTAPRYYNSVYAFDDNGQVTAAADKVHLVPFGEYLPFEKIFDALGLNAIAAMPGGFSAGPSHNLIAIPGLPVFYPLICYEAIFPDEIEPGDAAADVLVNITNDSWFGATPGPFQHFQQARILAVETGKPMIRVANSGISAVVDEKGRIISGLDLQAVGSLDAAIPGKTASIQNRSGRRLNFGLILGLAFMIAIFTRVSFILNKN